MQYVWITHITQYQKGNNPIKKWAEDLNRCFFAKKTCRRSSSVQLVQFSHSVASDSLWPHGLQHTRSPCPSPTPGAYSNSCRSSRWCHPTISSPVVPFSFHLQSFSASGSVPVSPFFASGGQSIGVFSFNISPSNEYSGLISFRMDWLDLLAVQGILKSLQHHSSKASILQHSSFLYGPAVTPIHDYWKNHSLWLDNLCWQCTVCAF